MNWTSFSTNRVGVGRKSCASSSKSGVFIRQSCVGPRKSGLIVTNQGPYPLTRMQQTSMLVSKDSISTNQGILLFSEAQIRVCCYQSGCKRLRWRCIWLLFLRIGDFGCSGANQVGGGAFEGCSRLRKSRFGLVFYSFFLLSSTYFYVFFFDLEVWTERIFNGSLSVGYQ